MNQKEIDRLEDLAHQLLEYFPTGKWHYDDGVTDTNFDEITFRGKAPVVECVLTNGKQFLIADPYSYHGYEVMDAIGKFIAAANPEMILDLIKEIKNGR